MAGKDEDGKPKIYFDDPERAEDAPDASDASDRDKSAEGPEKSGSDKNGQSCTCNTDKVDREIEKLKKQKQELEQQINRETDESKIEDLKAKFGTGRKRIEPKRTTTHIGVSTLHIHTPNVCRTTAKEKSRRTSRKIATPRTAAFEK